VLALEQDRFRLNHLLKRESCSTLLSLRAGITFLDGSPSASIRNDLALVAASQCHWCKCRARRLTNNGTLPVEVISRACSRSQSSDRLILEVARALVLIAASHLFTNR